MSTITNTINAGLSADAGAPLPKTLKDATQAFEAIFVAKLFETMRQSVPHSGLLGEGSGEQTFQQMLDQQYASEIGQSSRLGIGRMLYAQLATGDKSAPTR